MTHMTIPQLTADQRDDPIPIGAAPSPYRFGRASLAVSGLAIAAYLVVAAIQDRTSESPIEADDVAVEETTGAVAPDETEAAEDLEPAEPMQFTYVVPPDAVAAATASETTTEDVSEGPALAEAMPPSTDAVTAAAIEEVMEQVLADPAEALADPLTDETDDAASLLNETLSSEGGVERPAIGLPDLGRPGVAEAWLAQGILVLTLETSRGPFVATRAANAVTLSSAYTDLVILRPEDLATRSDLVQPSNMRLRSTPSGAFNRTQLETELILQQEALDITAPVGVHFSDRAAAQILTLSEEIQATLPVPANGQPRQPGDIRIDICFDGQTPNVLAVTERMTGLDIVQQRGCS